MYNKGVTTNSETNCSANNQDARWRFQSGSAGAWEASRDQPRREVSSWNLLMSDSVLGSLCDSR